MKFTIERDALHAALSAVGSQTRTKNVPILGHVLLAAKGDQLAVTGHSIVSCASMTSTAQVDAAGAIAVPADRLTRLVAGFPTGGQVMIAVKGDRATVRCGRATYQLSTMQADDFPPPLTADGATSLRLGAEDARRLLLVPSTCAAGAGESRLYLQGVFLHGGEDGIDAVGTDGHTFIHVRKPGKCPQFDGVIIPLKTAEEIVALGKACEVSIDISDRAIVAKAGARTFASKLIDGKFPDWRRVIPQRHANILTFNSAEMTAAVVRLSTAREDLSHSAAVKCSWGNVDGFLTVSSRSAVASGDEEIECEIACGEPGEVGLNAEYMKRLIESSNGKTTTFYVDGPGAPVRVETSDDADFVGVIMPMRV